jgi:hypothetical protein
MGECRYSSTILNLSTRWRWVFSFIALKWNEMKWRTTSGESSPGTRCIRRWEGSRTTLDVKEMRTFSSPCQQLNPESSVVQPIACHFNNSTWTTVIFTRKTICAIEYFEVEVNLWPTDSRPVCPGVRRPSGTRDQFFFLLEISFRQLRVCYFVAPSLTRGRVCNLLYNCFWPLPEQSLLGQSPAELTAISYCLIWDSLNLEGQVPVFISPKEQGGPDIPLSTGFLFCRLLRLVRTTVEVF